MRFACQEQVGRMTAQLHDRRSRAAGIAGTLAVHVLVAAGLLLLAPRFAPPEAP
jgi:hypothetical protein